MTTMLVNNLVNAVLATGEQLPPIQAAGYEYVLAGNGLFIRAEDSRMEAMIPVAYATLKGLQDVDPYARLKTPLIPSAWLWSVLNGARRNLPNEVLYQFHWDGATWRCIVPPQSTGMAFVGFIEEGAPLVDLHSHGHMKAFFSTTDDSDEQGFRFYAVVGHVDTRVPQLLVRAGVYGHHWDVPATTIFEATGPFTDLYDQKADETNEYEEQYIN